VTRSRAAGPVICRLCHIWPELDCPRGPFLATIQPYGQHKFTPRERLKALVRNFDPDRAT